MIIDSDILIAASRGVEAAIDFLIQIGESETLSITAVSWMELLAGAQSKTDQRRIERFLRRFVLLVFDEASTRRAIDLMREYHLSHGLAMPDAFIAACALESKQTLATINIRDFKFISGLKLKTI